MRLLNGIAAMMLALALGGCGNSNSDKMVDFSTKENRKVTRIAVYKEERKMYLLNRREVLAQYDIDLGFAPAGTKRFAGDGKTPEGRYFIDRRNPNSDFHLSLGISYPNGWDINNARTLGRDPGSDIFIHGKDNQNPSIGDDWTLGCIAVSNQDMEEIYAVVREGIPIDIYP